MPRTKPPATSFISHVMAAPGQPLTIPASHVEYDPEHGYRTVSGAGRQASTAGAAR